MGYEIDLQEREIVRQLILNPRISDNQISKNTKIPLKTVNRKRKKLEEQKLLQYFTYLDTSVHGTQDFSSRQMYIVTFRRGITREIFFKQFDLTHLRHVFAKHILESHLGERDGRLVLMLVMESRKDTDMIEIFNAEIVPFINQRLGESIADVMSFSLTHMLQMLHNYTPATLETITKFGLNPDNIFVADSVKQKKK